MKDSPSPPPAPNPQQTAAAQTQSNLQTAIANAALNRVNQQTPWGSITYTQGPVDPTTGVPTWSSHIQLTPQQQQLLEQQQGLSSGRNTMAQQIMQQQGGRITAPLDFSSLHPMYDNGKQYAGAVNAAPSQTPQAPPQAQGPNPQSMQPMGMTPAQFQQLLASLQGSNAGGAPAAAPPPGAPPGAAPSGAPPAPPSPQTGYTTHSGISGNFSAPQGTTGWLQGQLANLSSSGGDPSSLNLPPWLSSQVHQTFSNSGGDGGSPTPQWTLGDGNGVIKTQDGQSVVQIQDPRHMMNQSSSAGGSWLKDPSAVTYDPQLGFVTPPDNIKTNESTPGAQRAMQFAGMALAGGGLADAAGLLGGAGGLAGDESAGLSMANPFAAGGTQLGAPVTELSTQAASPSLLQQGMTNLSQGRGLLGLRPGVSQGASLLASLLRRPQSTSGGQ